MKITDQTTADDIALCLYSYGLEKSEAPAVLAWAVEYMSDWKWGRKMPLSDAVAGLLEQRKRDAKWLADAPERAAKALLDQAWGLGALARVEAAWRDRLAISESHRQWVNRPQPRYQSRDEWAAEYDKDHDN